MGLQSAKASVLPRWAIGRDLRDVKFGQFEQANQESSVWLLAAAAAAAAAVTAT